MNNEEVVDSFATDILTLNPLVILRLHIQKIVQDRNYFLSYTIYGTKTPPSVFPDFGVQVDF